MKDPFFCQTIDVHKANGEVIQGIAASVQDRKILIRADGHQIASGDKIVHHVSTTGNAIQYSVVYPGFREKTLGYPATYRMIVQPA